MSDAEHEFAPGTRLVRIYDVDADGNLREVLTTADPRVVGATQNAVADIVREFVGLDDEHE